MHPSIKVAFTLKNRKQLHSIFLLIVLGSIAACATDPYRPALEPFDRNSDYNYRLSTLPKAELSTVSINENGFEWPTISASSDTVFLEISLSEASGEYPSLKVTFAGENFTQYFEENGSGLRYLDLSSLLSTSIGSGDFVQLDGDGVRWISESTTLTAFSNSPVKDQRVLVVAPHPDDAEIAAYGLYESSLAHVVTVTAGDAGGFNFKSLWEDSGKHYREKGRIRTLDSLTVPLLGGLTSDEIRNLGYYDATLSQLWKRRPNPVNAPLADLEDTAFFRRLNFDVELKNRPFQSTWPQLVSDLLNELERVNPQTIAVPHPMLDGHGDHQFAALAVFEALSRWDADPDILLYTNHAVGNEAYPLGPKDGVMGLPAWNGGNLHITGLYSHQLSEDAQKHKLIALEAMHDLRPFDPRDGSPVSSTPYLYDYFRRGPRPNEVFLVTDSDGAQAIYEEYFENYQER